MSNQTDMNLIVKIIHASAGTGKTYTLTGEFINMIIAQKDFLESMRKLVAITFSERAACEMKSRIVQGIFERVSKQLENEETRIKCENQLFRLRVSTIHSFCRSLLKRFSFLFQIDPNFTVCEVEQSYIFFRRALSLFLENEDPDRLLNDLEPMRVKQFLEYMEEMHKTHPQVFLGEPGNYHLAISLYKCFREIEKIYQDIKKQNSLVDFNDLECLAYLLITEHPESLNILNDFDENIDFIFVDEFQDTNLLQWKIIREFSREWTSGRGAKAETGKKYGLYFVGDRKQSIYFFRGAESTVFDDAKEFFAPYVKREFLTTNYRSFPEIIEFVNKAFDGQEEFSEQENLVVCEKFSQRNHGFVEINLFDKKNISIKDEKKIEYSWITEKILSLIEKKFPIYDKEKDSFRPVEFKDIAILMRKRTHLEVLEDTFRQYSIPFVNVGGIGFYQEPEIIFLISLLSVISDCSDTLSLKNLNNSIFPVDSHKIQHWRLLLEHNFASTAVDKIIMELDLFSKLSSQGCANVEKFLMLVHEMRDIPFFQMVQNFRRISSRKEEPKADVFSEQQNAVRVLTVHASKGLEFPIVFLAAIEQGKPDTSKIKLIHKKTIGNHSDYMFIFKKDKDDFYNHYVKKLEQEEKRTLYVALTRAKQGLIITGAKQKSVWFDLLSNLEKDYSATASVFSGRKPASEMLNRIKKNLPVITKKPVSPVSFSSTKEVFDFTGEKIGTVIHKIIWEISNNLAPLKSEFLIERVIFLLKKMKADENTEEIKIHLANLEKPEIKEIILPKQSAFSELQFLTEINGECVYGIVDRVIINNGICKIYDFKTRQKPEIQSTDIEQLKLYKEGMRKLFDCKQIQTFIVFTFCGIIKEVKT